MNNNDLGEPLWEREFTLGAGGGAPFRVTVRENTSGWSTSDLIAMFDFAIDEVRATYTNRHYFVQERLRIVEVCFTTYRGERMVGRVNKAYAPGTGSVALIRLKPLDHLGLSELDYLSALGKGDIDGQFIGQAPADMNQYFQRLMVQSLVGPRVATERVYAGPLRFTSASRKRDAVGRAVMSRTQIARAAYWDGLRYPTRMLRNRVQEQHRAVLQYKHAMLPAVSADRHEAALVALREAVAQVEKAEELLKMIAREEAFKHV